VTNPLSVLERAHVPGSKWMYGSSLRRVTLMPRDLEDRGERGGCYPLPKEETTPPDHE